MRKIHPSWRFLRKPSRCSTRPGSSCRALPADAVLLLTETDLDWDRVRARLGDCRLLVAAEDGGLTRQLRTYPDLTVLDIDPGPTPTQERMSLALLEAVRSDKLHQGSDVVVVYNGIEVGQGPHEAVDSLSVIHLGEHLERLTSQDLRRLDTQVPLETLRAVVDLALEIGREGREGHPVGTMFVVGDTRKVLTMSRPMNFNPFRGYSHAERDMRDHGGARTDQGHRPAGGRHRHPPRRRGRGRLRAHRGARQGHHAEHGPRHAPRGRGLHQQMHQGRRRRRQPVFRLGANLSERYGGTTYRAAGPADDLGQPRLDAQDGHNVLRVAPARVGPIGERSSS